ncbi:serine/threonine-protein kinase [Nocardiopsis algeriensis]|uniref:serine/threonine-protein kinase n=1 Tax=Nocardiopsis algeriensis TaxID=1478215 RepID=UPI003B4325BD
MPPEVALPPHVRPLADSDPVWVGPHRLIGRLADAGSGVVHAAVSPRGEPLALRVAGVREVPGAGRRGETPDTGGLVLGPVDSGVHRGRPWAAVTYRPAPDLGEHVRTRGALAGKALLVLAAGTAEALAVMHGTDTAHGDIVPENVLVTSDGPRVVDYGIARRVDDGTAAEPEGRIGWLAPERYEGARPDPRSDVFSWACLVAYAATGREPLGGRAPLYEAAWRAREQGVDLSALPPDLGSVLERALDADPACRPSAEEVFLMCLLLLGADESATRNTWPELLRGYTRAFWPRVDTRWHQPERWVAAAYALDEAAAAAGESVWVPENRVAVQHLRAAASPPESPAPDPEPAPEEDRAPAAPRRSRHRKTSGAGRVLVLGLLGCLGFTVVAGGGYALFDALAEDVEPVSQTPEEETDDVSGPAAGPLSGTDLVAASAERLLEARSLEMTVLTHAGNGEGYGQPLPADTGLTPTLNERILYRAEPEALRWVGTVSGSRVSDLALADGQLLRAEGTAWNGPAAWAPAGPEADEEAFDPEQILRPLVRAAQEGEITAEEETVHTAPVPAQDAYGHLAGEDPPDGVPAIRIEGSLPASDTGTEARFTLVATEDGVPLAFATESAPGGPPLGGRPLAEEPPEAFLGASPEYWYTLYTFVGIDTEVDPRVPAVEDIAAHPLPGT